MSTFVFVDIKTKLYLPYTKEDRFTIYVRQGTNRPKQLHAYQGDSVELAFTKYHDLILPEGWRKYLYHEKSLDMGKKVKIYSSQGYGDPTKIPSPITMGIGRKNFKKTARFDVRISDMPQCLVKELLVINNIHLGLPARGTVPHLLKLLLAHFLYNPTELQIGHLKMARGRLEEMNTTFLKGVE